MAELSLNKILSEATQPSDSLFRSLKEYLVTPTKAPSCSKTSISKVSALLKKSLSATNNEGSIVLLKTIDHIAASSLDSGVPSKFDTELVQAVVDACMNGDIDVRRPCLETLTQLLQLDPKYKDLAKRLVGPSFVSLLDDTLALELRQAVARFCCAFATGLTKAQRQELLTSEQITEDDLKALFALLKTAGDFSLQTDIMELLIVAASSKERQKFASELLSAELAKDYMGVRPSFFECDSPRFLVKLNATLPPQTSVHTYTAKKVLFDGAPVSPVECELDPSLPFYFHFNMGSNRIAFECVDAMMQPRNVSIEKDTVTDWNCTAVDTNGGMSEIQLIVENNPNFQIVTVHLHGDADRSCERFFRKDHSVAALPLTPRSSITTPIVVNCAKQATPKDEAAETEKRVSFFKDSARAAGDESASREVQMRPRSSSKKAEPAATQSMSKTAEKSKARAEDSHSKQGSKLVPLEIVTTPRTRLGQTKLSSPFPEINEGFLAAASGADSGVKTATKKWAFEESQPIESGNSGIDSDPAVAMQKFQAAMQEISKAKEEPMQVDEEPATKTAVEDAEKAKKGRKRKMSYAAASKMQDSSQSEEEELRRPPQRKPAAAKKSAAKSVQPAAPAPSEDTMPAEAEFKLSPPASPYIPRAKAVVEEEDTMPTSDALQRALQAMRNIDDVEEPPTQEPPPKKRNSREKPAPEVPVLTAPVVKKIAPAPAPVVALDSPSPLLEMKLRKDEESIMSNARAFLTTAREKWHAMAKRQRDEKDKALVDFTRVWQSESAKLQKQDEAFSAHAKAIMTGMGKCTKSLQAGTIESLQAGKVLAKVVTDFHAHHQAQEAKHASDVQKCQQTIFDAISDVRSKLMEEIIAKDKSAEIAKRQQMVQMFLNMMP
eukprot:m.154654 g.154654  ORF g.154654 m.154654 type:complete len:890 (-) comp9793_c0_seq3:1662-4331(-)